MIKVRSLGMYEQIMFDPEFDGVSSNANKFGFIWYGCSWIVEKQSLCKANKQDYESNV